MSTPEEIRYEGQQQDREDKRRERLEEMARRGGPDAPDPCERCDGEGSHLSQATWNSPVLKHECPRCLGTGVQP